MGGYPDGRQPVARNGTKVHALEGEEIGFAKVHNSVVLRMDKSDHGATLVVVGASIPNTNPCADEALLESRVGDELGSSILVVPKHGHLSSPSCPSGCSRVSSELSAAEDDVSVACIEGRVAVNESNAASADVESSFNPSCNLLTWRSWKDRQASARSDKRI